MRGTLTHATDATSPRRLASLVLTALLGLATSPGCNRVETDPDARQATTTSPTASHPFAWPSDPSHPVLRLEIDGSAGPGHIDIELMPELAPVTVARIIELASAGYYDGTTFHRVIPDFMIQGGDPRSRDRDPTNDGLGGHDEQLPDEFGEAPFVRGVVGLGNRGRPGSTSTQFFVMQADDRNLDGRYTPIGRVVAGLELVDAISRVQTDRTGRWGPRDRPIENVVMKHVSIVGPVSALAPSLRTDDQADDPPAS
ncbi:MAG: peptidylprolyl isomerase [Spirochaetaceae bacterium]|nr:peptidylprolyl isomerase [Myxococcales bacterium]MCB9725799.1 peptidylprolyl isomerase [Spirochaetaceae bacterium]HPG25985.1 peptidylprolyl isomerase [Myxococcota bacterium]